MEEPQRVCSKCGASYPADVIFCPKDGIPLGGKKTEIVDDPYLELEIAGQFKIQQLIGIGAMGRVYRAHQKGIDRDVAIKVLHRDLLRNPNVMARFVREAKVASRLFHPNVVQVLMAGEIERLNADVGGEAYLVMEFLDGISLRSALAAAGGAMPLPRALHIILQVCDAVGEAHMQGIVHRDLKPENVMLVRRGDDPDFVKVLDFGVARIDWADTSVATQAGVIFGTARYISPEGAQGKSVTAHSDVYSIAVMLFQCLAGQAPFDADNPVGILIKHTNEPAPDVRSVPRASYVPEPIARVIAANLEKAPGERCRDARDLGRALVDAARASGLSPDDLVMRSTLLGGARGALSLASMQRTKQHDLSADFAERLAGKATPSGTQMVESDADTATPPPVSAKPEPPPVSSPTASGVDRLSRPSGVDPTMHDEPASELLSSPRVSAPPSLTAPGRPQPTATPSGEFSSTFARPSFPDELRDPPEPAPPRFPRWLLVASCFAVGAAVTALGAHALGVFDRVGSAEVEPSVQSYADRANAAIARDAFDSPAGENVRDLTDAALQRWPGAPKILEVRRNAAQILVRRAHEKRATDEAEALRLARLAMELDVESSEASALVSELSSPPSKPAPSSEPVASTAPSSKRVKKPPTIKKPPPKPEQPAAPAPPTAEPPTKPAPEPPSEPGGRWL